MLDFIIPKLEKAYSDLNTCFYEHPDSNLDFSLKELNDAIEDLKQFRDNIDRAFNLTQYRQQQQQALTSPSTV